MTRKIEKASAPFTRPEGEFAEMIALADKAFSKVVGNEGVWEEEKKRPGAEPIPWPFKQPPKQYKYYLYSELLRRLAIAWVDLTLEAIKDRNGIAVPKDGADPAFQLVLRVCKRAAEEADREIVVVYGGSSRIDGKRYFSNWLKQRDMEKAARAGLKGKAAAEAAGLSVASSYRAQHWKPKKTG